jgi:hypothetical protein
MNKDELLQKIKDSRQALLDTLAKVPREQRSQPLSDGAWTLKDLIVHLNYWEGQLVTLLFQLRSGAVPTTAHFSGKNVDEINAAWYQQGKERGWEAAWNDFSGLHAQILRRAGAFSDAELNRPSFHPRLKEHPLWEWIAGDSCDHEDEHRAQIEAWLEQTASGKPRV